MIKYPERKLYIVPEDNDENGNPRCWYIASNDEKPHYIWIYKYDEKEYVVEDSYGNNRAGKVYKTLWGAKRSAEGIIWRQEESGAYSD